MNLKRPDTPYPPKLPPLKKGFKGSDLDLNGLLKIKEEVIFENKNCSRKSLIFQKKASYNHIEVIELLEKLDSLWEDNNNRNYDYYA